MQKYSHLPFQNVLLIANLLFFLGIALIIDGLILQQTTSYNGILQNFVSKPFLSENWDKTTFIVASILTAISSLLHQANYWRFYLMQAQQK